MTKKKIIGVSGILVVMILFIAGITYAISPEQQAKAFADKSFSTGIADYVLTSCDYTTEENVPNTYLGAPILNYTIPIDEFDDSISIKENIHAMPMYVFPVMLNDTVVTDFSVMLCKGEWQVIDIGGNQSKYVYDMAKKNHISEDEIALLRFGGQTFLLSLDESCDIVCSPYVSNDTIGLEKEKIVSSDTLKKHFKERQQEYLNFRKDEKNKDIIGGHKFGAYGPIDFSQKESMLVRIINFGSYCIKT
jgi:hypothetical protein